MPKTNRTELHKQIGQLLIIGFDGQEMSPRLGALLSDLQPGGVILFARNITGAIQTHSLLEDCQKRVALTLFTCVDLEGGRVDRFREVFGRAPSAADVYQTRRPALFRKHGKLIGDCCRALGFNTDFAPVVDLALAASRTVMSSRAVSEDPKQVVTYARGFLDGLKAARVVGSIKHFPGLGGANLDTHLELPSVDRSFKQLWEQDIYPYRALRRDSPMVLVGHANYAGVTRDGLPASLSKQWVTEVLRKKVGYRGLIVSDDLEMGGVLKAAPIESAAEQFIRAGGDICLVCQKEEYVRAVHEHLLKQAERDPAFAKRVREASSRVLKFKWRAVELKRRIPAPTRDKVEKLKHSVLEFTEKVLVAHENSGREPA